MSTNPFAQIECRAMLFDFDGTLVDSLQDIVLCVNLLRERQGLAPLDSPSVQRAVGRGARELVRQTLAEVIDSEETLDRLYADLESYYAEHAVRDSGLYPGCRELLDELSAQVKLAILSNKPLAITERCLELLNLTRYFALVRCPENSTVIKPHPGAVVELIEALGCEPDEAVLIGDSENDFAAGRGAGVFTIGLRHGYFNGKEPDPDLWLDSLPELLELYRQGTEQRG